MEPKEETPEKIKPTVQLSGEDGNAMAIISRVRMALRDAGDFEQATAFVKEATSGDYDHVIQTCMKYVNCE